MSCDKSSSFGKILKNYILAWLQVLNCTVSIRGSVRMRKKTQENKGLVSFTIPIFLTFGT
jgi:hypothetical protein